MWVLAATWARRHSICWTRTAHCTCSGKLSPNLRRAGISKLAVATVLNVSPDHLDRHGSMPRYHQAKHRIFAAAAKAVINRDDPLTIPLVGPDVEVISWRMGKPELSGFGLVDSAGGNTSATVSMRCCPAANWGWWVDITSPMHWRRWRWGMRPDCRW